MYVCGQKVKSQGHALPAWSCISIGLFAFVLILLELHPLPAVDLCDFLWPFNRSSNHCVIISLPLPKKEVLFLVRSVCLSVCLSVCPSDYSQRIMTKFFGGVGHGSRTKWYNFGGDPDHASDPEVQRPKSGSSGSAEVCALWVLLVKNEITLYFQTLQKTIDFFKSKWCNNVGVSGRCSRTGR